MKGQVITLVTSYSQVQANNNDMVSVAQSYAKRRWPVLPLHGLTDEGCTCGNVACQSPGKHPRITGWKEQSTTNEDRIRGWWKRWPNSNVAIVTGRTSGIVVLDVDPRHGGDESLAALEAEHGLIPSTVQALTGGGGQHFFFRHPGRHVPNQVSLAPGLDIRGDGGYIVAPSSRGRFRFYEWEASSHPEDVQLAPMPAWLLALIERDMRAKSERVNTAAVLAGLPEGERNTGLFKLACKRRREDFPYARTEADILEAASNCIPPYPADDARRIVANVYDRYPAGSSPANDMPNVCPPAYEEVDIDALLDDHESVNALIPGLIYAGGMTLIGAAPGTGKTTLVSAIIAALLKRQKAFDLLDTGQLEGPIVVFTELARASLAETVKRMVNVYQLERRDREGKFKVYPILGESVLNKQIRDGFISRCQEASLVVVDTFDAWLAADPNKTSDALTGWSALQTVANAGSSVLVLDHSGKNNFQSKLMSAAAGSSAKLRHPDIVFRLDRNKQPPLHNVLSVVKDRFGLAAELLLTIDEKGRLVAEASDSSGNDLSQLQRAKIFAGEYLSMCERAKFQTIVEAGAQEGHAKKTIQRALDNLCKEGLAVKPERGVYAGV